MNSYNQNIEKFNNFVNLLDNYADCLEDHIRMDVCDNCADAQDSQATDVYNQLTASRERVLDFIRDLIDQQ